MFLEIVSPEATLFRAEVESVSVPGVGGQFQMLDNHAPIVSVLAKGEVKIFTKKAGSEPEGNMKLFRKDPTNNQVLFFGIEGGVVEMKNNKVIVLAD